MEFLAEHEEYQTIDEDTAEAISAVMGVKDFMKNKEKYQNGEGYNMCTAIRELWEDGRSEGIALGRSEGITLSAAIFRAVNSGIADNEQIAHQCGCSSEQVAEIRSVFGL